MFYSYLSLLHVFIIFIVPNLQEHRKYDYIFEPIDIISIEEQSELEICQILFTYDWSEKALPLSSSFFFPSPYTFSLWIIVLSQCYHYMKTSDVTNTNKKLQKPVDKFLICMLMDLVSWKINTPLQYTSN